MIGYRFPRGIEIVAGGLVRNPEGELLLTVSPKWLGKWVLPGGHIDPGETILEAGARELKEETGLNRKQGKIIYSGELINSPEFHRPAHFIFFTCLFDTDATEVRLEERELSDYRWVNPEEAFTLDLCTHTRLALMAYKEAADLKN